MAVSESARERQLLKNKKPAAQVMRYRVTFLGSMFRSGNGGSGTICGRLGLRGDERGQVRQHGSGKLRLGLWVWFQAACQPSARYGVGTTRVTSTSCPCAKLQVTSPVRTTTRLVSKPLIESASELLPVGTWIPKRSIC